MTTNRDPANRWRRLARTAFGLRPLLALVLLIGGALGWIVHAARVQREGVATVVRLGGQCRYDWEFRFGRPAPGAIPGWRKWLIEALGPDYVGSVTQVHVGYRSSAVKPTLDDLAKIGRLTRLESLSLADVTSVRQALPQLRNLSRLKHLELFETAGAREGDLAPLANFAELEGLQLSLSRISDADLATLAGLTRLTHLSLSTPVALKPWHDPRSLQTSGTDEFSNAGLARLRALPNLVSLFLSGTAVDDAGVASLVGFPRLKEIRLAFTSVTDVGLLALTKRPGSKIIDVVESKVSPEGVAAARLALPGTTITHRVMPASVSLPSPRPGEDSLR